MIQIENVTRRYGDLIALEDVSLSIPAGQIVGLLGHNGAGKTTLMRMLCGSLDPTAGTMTVNGHDTVEDRLRAQGCIGYLPERAPLYLDMPVWDHLLMIAQLRGLPPEQQEAVALEAAKDAGLTERLAQPVRELSKGFRQRVGIACAILHRPAVLVLDEPTNGLDPDQIHAIRDLIRRLGERTTILLSTHILQEVEAVCDRVLMLVGGRLVEDAPLTDLLHTDRHCAQFTGLSKDQLSAAEGIEDVEQTGPGSFTFRVKNEVQDVGNAMVSLARQHNATLVAFHPEVVRLEAVFNARMSDSRSAG